MEARGHNREYIGRRRDIAKRSKFNVGVRSIVVPNRYEVYASYGNRFGRSSNAGFVVAGFRLQTPEFLP